MVKSYLWNFRACERVNQGSDLKKLARDYLQSHKLMCSDPNQGHLKINGMQTSSFISRCTRHKECERKYRFTLRSRDVLSEENLAMDGDQFLLTQEIGECNGPLDIEAIKKFWCHRYAGTGKPEQILKKMSKDGIPEDHRPKARQLESRNALLRGTAANRRYDGKFVDTMKAFCNNPPEGIKVWQEESVVEEKTIRIAFSVPDLTAKAVDLQKSGDVFWLMDGTFNTNFQGLVLIGLGPAGIGIERNLPTMKALPYSFVLANAEDAEACKLAIQQPLSLQDELEPKEDGI